MPPWNPPARNHIDYTGDATRHVSNSRSSPQCPLGPSVRRSTFRKTSPLEEVEPTTREREEPERRAGESIRKGLRPLHLRPLRRAHSVVSTPTDSPDVDEGKTSGSFKRSEAGFQSPSPKSFGPIRSRTQHFATLKVCTWNFVVCRSTRTTARPRRLRILFVAMSL